MDDPNINYEQTPSVAAFAYTLGTELLYTDKHSIKNLKFTAILILTVFKTTNSNIITFDISIHFNKYTSTITKRSATY